MSNFGKTQPHYLRALGKNGKTRQVTLPTSIIRASNFKQANQVVIKLLTPDTLTVTTLERWFQEGRE